ncbi:hypothetical protein N0V88_007530 [Collariella sp. IMI 366227]|nr:hypothetical protein N0V88_007530 [Collariella sp. IMI 366227]
MHLPALLNLTALTSGHPPSLPTVRSSSATSTSRTHLSPTTPNLRLVRLRLPSRNLFLPYGPWTLLNTTDLLPFPGPWTNTSAPATWAPDVQYISATNSFVLYYAAALPKHHGGGKDGSKNYKCIGAATSFNITGPYTPLPKPIICPAHDGGAIDASGFWDEADGSRWIMYKIDGSAQGPGGKCGNGKPPGKPTPLMLQRVDEKDGVTMLGKAVKVVDRDPEVDGPLVEAPSLVRLREVPQGVKWRYVLFFSSHCYNEEEYDVRYAVAEGETFQKDDLADPSIDPPTEQGRLR